MTAAVASCTTCRRLVCVVDATYTSQKLRRHKNAAGMWCSAAATARRDTGAARQRALRQRFLGRAS